MTDLSQEREELIRRFHELGNRLDKSSSTLALDVSAKAVEAQALVFGQLVSHDMLQYGVAMHKQATERRPTNDEWGS